jgi:hypothetical protein
MKLTLQHSIELAIVFVVYTLILTIGGFYKWAIFIAYVGLVTCARLEYLRRYYLHSPIPNPNR